MTPGTGNHCNNTTLYNKNPYFSWNIASNISYILYLFENRKTNSIFRSFISDRRKEKSEPAPGDPAPS